jgi:hypothetical protein
VVFYDPDRIYAPGGFMDWSRDFARGRPETPPAQAPGAPGIADSRLVGYAGAFAREKIGGWTP